MAQSNVDRYLAQRKKQAEFEKETTAKPAIGAKNAGNSKDNVSAYLKSRNERIAASEYEQWLQKRDVIVGKKAQESRNTQAISRETKESGQNQLQDMNEQLTAKYGVREKTAAERLADELKERYGSGTAASEYARLTGRSGTGIQAPEEIALGVMDRPYRDGVIGAIEEEQKPARVIQKPGTIELGVMDRPYREGVVGGAEETTEADDGYNVLEAALANLKAGFANIGANAAKTINAAMEPGRNALVDAAKWLTEHTQAPDMPEDTAQAMKDRKAIGDPVYGYFVDPADRLNAIADAEDAKGGFAAQIGGQVIRNAASQIPNVIIGAMTGGTSAAMQAQEAIRTAGNFGAAVLESARQMAMNPMFQNSVMQMYGARYEDAREAGADAYVAALTATITTLMNSAIEMGGGVENLPFTRATVGEWVKNALGEGKEEVVQQVIDNLGQKLYVDGSIPWYSQEDERAVINPGVLAENALVGTLAGGAMTAPGMAINSALGRYDERQAKAEDAGRYPQITEAESEAAGRTDRYGDVLRGQETIARLAEEAVAEQEAEKQAEAAQTRVYEAAPARAAQAGAQAATETPARARANVPAEVSRAADRYGEDAGVFESHYKGGDADSYARGFEAMYTAGRVGLKMEQIGESTNMLTQGMDEVTKKAIWTAGRNSMMRAVTPGVRRMDTKKATNAQKRQYTMLDAVGKRYGIEFMIVDSIEDGRANGAYSGGRRIVVASDAMDGAIVQAGVHELVHYLKRTDADGYSVLKEVVVGHLTKENSAFILSEAVKERMAEYAGNGQKLTEEDAIEEIVAEAVPTIFANEESVKAFVGKDRTLAEKVRDFIVKFVKEIREIAEKYMQDQGREEIANLINKADALTEIAETFDRALEAAGEKWDAEFTTGIELLEASKYSVKDRKVIEGYLKAVDSNILEAARMYRKDKNAKFARFKLGDVKEKEAQEIKGLLGFDAGGFTHNIDKNAFNHIEKRHGTDGEADQTMADLNDVARIGWVLANYDTIERAVDKNGDPVYTKGYLDSDGNPAAVVVYRKKINGVYYVSEAVADNKWKKLWVTTAFMSENKKDASQTPDTSSEAPGYTSENESAAAFDSSISDSLENVNEQTRFSINSDAFRRWFGDSKIVNEDGSPKVMYHGSAASFTAFDKRKARSSGLYGKGFYFTDSDSHAGQYGQLYQVYLKVQNPLKPGGSTATKAQVRKFLEAVAENEDDYSIENYGTYDVNEILSKVYSKDAFRVIQDINATAIGDFVEAVKLFNEVNGTKYDGIVVPTETVVFEPTQIKSATDNIGTYDPDNPDIRFSLNKRSAYGPNQPYDWAGDGTYTSFTTAEEARSAAEEMRMDVETEAFMEWFAGSKVVDEKGEPKIMYHGTSGSGFTQFDTYGSRYGLMGTGSYFTDDPEIAESYTKKGKGKKPGIYPVYLSIQRPADMDQKITAEEAKAWRRYFSDYVLDSEIKAGQTRDEALRAVERGFEQEGMLKDEAGDYVVEFFENQGFDGITHIGGQVFGGTKHRVYIAFEPTQVKSATGNFGDFSAEDADIRFSLNDTSKAESVFTEEGRAMGPDVQLRSKTVAAYAAKALKTGLTVKMEQQITGIANKILKEAGSSYDKGTMIENLKKVIGEYAESGATEETLRALTEMSKTIIEKSSRRDDTLRNQYADLRKKLRETPISLTETQKQEAANEAGSYGEWRKGLFGAVNLTSDGISLDSLWGELSSQYPDMFPPETGEAEMAGKIKDFALMMRPRYENPYGMDMDSAALEMGMRLQGDMMVVAGAKDEAKAMYGTAEKLRQKALDEYKEKLKEQKQQRVADFQKIAADLKAAKAAGDSKAQAAVMNRYRAALKRTALDEAFAEVRATYREREAQKAENRMRAELRGKAEKRAAELMEMLAGRKKGKRVPTVLQGVVMDVLKALDINGRNAAGVGEETVKSQAFRAKLDALREFYERVWNQQSRGESPDGLDGLMMTISERNIAEIQDALSELGAGNKYLLREMDSQQLRSLNELLKTVKHTVESVGKLWKMKRYASVAQMGDDAIREMDDRGARRFTEDTMAGKGRDFFALDMMEPVSYGERLGEAGKEIIQGLMDGEKVKFGTVRSAAEATRKMLKDVKATGYDIGKWRKTIREVKLGDGRTVRMSETQLMSLYLTAKRAQGMKHLLGEGITIPSEKKTGVQNKILLTQADITKMAGMISDQQRALADRMGRYLSGELAKAGNNVTQRLYLYDAFTEENYWPITSDPNELKTQEPEGERAFNAIVNAGFTKPVNQRASNPVIIMDAFDVFNRHVGEMASYIGYAEVMTDALAWLNYRQRDENGPTGKSVKDSMDKLLGKGGIEYLTKLIQDINGARRGGDGLQFAGVTARLMRNYKIAAVAGKIRVAIQQPTSIVRAAAEINPVYLLKGIKTGKGATQEMQKWSSLAWWKANGNYDIGVGKGTDEILWGKTERRDAVMEKITTQGGLVDPGRMDDWAWARMWSAVKREVKRTRPDLKEGSDEYFRAVAERFEYVVDRTQVVDTVMHRSDIMRTKDGLTQSLTAFKSEPIKSYNMLMRAIMEAGRNPKDKKAYAKVARATAVFVVSAAATAAATALVDAFKNRDDDDELWEYLTGGEFWRDYAEAFLNGFMSNVNLAYSIPLVGEALEAMKGEDVTMMQFDSLSGIYKAATTFYDHFFGENKKKTTVWGGMKPALTTISQLAGLPVSGLMANAEILLRMYDPKLLQAKDDMQTTKAAYGKLYEATVEGNEKTALSVRTELTKGLHGSTPKTPKEIDTGVARILAATDERILKAWQMRETGNQARELAALHKEIQKDGFTDAQTKYAVNNVENIMNGEYESLIEEGKTQEAEALRAKMAMYGMEPETPEEKDMTEELEAKTYQYKHLFAGIRNGDTDDVAVIAEVMEAESDAEDPAKSIRGEVSGEFKAEYIALAKAGKTREAETLAKKLAIVGIDSEDIEGWVKDDSYADMKEYVAAGNVYGAREAIERAIENGATVSGVVSSLNSRFKQEYLDLVMAGRNAEADRMAEVLQELGLYYKDGRTNYFRQSKLNEWVKEAEKKE